MALRAANGYEVVDRTFVTGERPSEFWGILGGRRDFACDQGWDGCIDAVDFVPTGAMVFTRSEQMIVPACVNR